MKKLARRLLRPRPSHHSVAYEDVREERHVFVFGVWGRSSTTALQRILNSTRAICIWGEPGQFLVDNLVEAHHQILHRLDAERSSDRVRAVSESFRRDDFSIETAMARADWQSSLTQVRQALLDLLAPPIPSRRLGFKEIRVRSPLTFRALRELFPNCAFVFLFRDPLAQWPSVQTKKGWPEAEDIELFAAQVETLGGWYLEQEGFFLEDTDLRDRGAVERLCVHLGLPGFQLGLLGDGVSAAPNKRPLAQADADFLRARLGDLYARLQARSRTCLSVPT